MGWIYLNGGDSQNTVNAFEEAFFSFLKQCLINKELLLNQLGSNNCYRFLIRTDDENDKIHCKNGKIFLKSKFLKNKNFKRYLIEYYGQFGVFVSGPKELIRQDNTSTNRWILELTINGKYSTM